MNGLAGGDYSVEAIFVDNSKLAWAESVDRSNQQSTLLSDPVPLGNIRVIAETNKIRFFPFSVVRGEGAYLIGEDGRRILDLSGTWGAATLGYAHEAVVEAVRRAAGEMALEDSLSYLVRLVDDSDTEVRLAAVWALGQIGGKPAAQALARVLKSDNPALREAAQEALQEVAFSANPLNTI